MEVTENDPALKCFPCSLIQIRRRFREAYCFDLQDRTCHLF